MRPELKVKFSAKGSNKTQDSASPYGGEGKEKRSERQVRRKPCAKHQAAVCSKPLCSPRATGAGTRPLLLAMPKSHGAFCERPRTRAVLGSGGLSEARGHGRSLRTYQTSSAF